MKWLRRLLRRDAVIYRQRRRVVRSVKLGSVAQQYQVTAARRFRGGSMVYSDRRFGLK
jgi:hypothetical protein